MPYSTAAEPHFMLVKVCLFSAKHPPVHLNVASGAAIQMLMRCPRPLLLGSIRRSKKREFIFLCQGGLQESPMTQAKRESLVNETNKQTKK